MSVSSNQMAALHLCENIYIPFGMETQLMMVMCHSCFLLVVPYFPWLHYITLYLRMDDIFASNICIGQY